MKRPVYIKAQACISAQDSLDVDAFFSMETPTQQVPMTAIEPVYKEYIKSRSLRRMGHMVRMGVCAAMKSLSDAGVENPDAILVGTGLGCLEDTEKFLSAIYESEENIGSPNQFIQSTHNNVAAQIALLLGCYNYNFTYVHRGFSFESALMDGMLHIREAADRKTQILVGACDEMTDLYRQVTNMIFQWNTEQDEKLVGTAQGEGAAFFVMSNDKEGQTVAEVEGMKMLYKPDAALLSREFNAFLTDQEISTEDIDLFMLGDYGAEHDPQQMFSQFISTELQDANKVGFKHLSGEHKTAGAFGMWLASEMIRRQEVPDFVKINDFDVSNIRRILLINNYNHGNYVMTLLRHVES